MVSLEEEGHGTEALRESPKVARASHKFRKEAQKTYGWHSWALLGHHLEHLV